MEFKKTELRNNINPLLRRVQRQVDLDNEQSKIMSILYSPLKKEKSFSKSMLNGFEDDEEETCFKPIKKQTRLGLLKVRGGR
jgi:hypothetical protein